MGWRANTVWCPMLTAATSNSSNNSEAMAALVLSLKFLGTLNCSSYRLGSTCRSLKTLRRRPQRATRSTEYLSTLDEGNRGLESMQLARTSGFRASKPKYFSVGVEGLAAIKLGK